MITEPEWANLNFKVDPAFRYEFRRLAAHYGISGVALLRMAVNEWREAHGGLAPVQNRFVAGEAAHV
ncbi:hypothetical protein GALL_243360 [mine drainage metagenome]|uniref:Uncharacterized protein n=1 Tax=mine drainage metagenome TaxID=410659 RepID=A0A1J5RCC7_9ZZZZ